MGAGNDGPAARTMQETGIAAAIEQKYRLLAAIQAALEVPLQGPREQMHAATGLVLFAHIDEMNGGHGHVANTMRKSDQMKMLLDLGVMPCFQRRRRRPENDGDAFKMRAGDRHIAG